jgi:hypothetical protein
MSTTFQKLAGWAFVAILLIGALLLAVGALPEAGSLTVSTAQQQGQQLLSVQGVKMTSSELAILNELNLGIVHISEPLWDADWEPTDGIHADTEHPTEAQMVRSCLKENGVWRVFRNLTNNNRFARVCKWPTPDEVTGFQYAFQIVEVTAAGVWVEVNAYVPKLADKTWFGFLDWMRAANWARAIQ